MNSKTVEYNELPLETLLRIAVENTTNEDPLKYLDSMYKTMNPEALKLALKDAKASLQRESKKNGKIFDVFMTLGGDGMHKAMYNGAIGALLWLNSYIDIMKDIKNIDGKDIETCKKVLRSIDLPSVGDYNIDEENGEIKQTSGCRHYARFLTSFVQWLTSGISAFPVKGRMRSNMELTRFLTGLAIDSFPSLPFTAYYVGSIKYDDQMKLAEKMAKSFNFNTYMTQISKELNDPKFVIVPENTPLVGIAGHPLANLILGQLRNDNVEWLGVFVENEEFSKLCLNEGLTSKEVLNYIYTTSLEAHKKYVLKGDNKIAKFIENQQLGKKIFELRHKVYGIETIEDEDDEIEKMTK